MDQRDALDAHHGHAVSNPYPVCHPDHDTWQQAFSSRLLELEHTRLVAEVS
jgi:hypothetical protein